MKQKDGVMEKVKFYRETDFEETETRSVPKEWEVEKLGKYLKEFIRGVSYNKKEIFLAESGEHIPLLRATNLQKGNIVFPDLSIRIEAVRKFSFFPIIKLGEDGEERRLKEEGNM